MGTIIDEDDMINVKSGAAGIYREVTRVGSEVSKGDIMARIIHPYEGTVEDEIKAPADGIIFFAHQSPLVTQNSLVFKMIKRLHK